MQVQELDDQEVEFVFQREEFDDQAGQLRNDAPLVSVCFFKDVLL
jgi:hypothetical protein